MEVKNAELSNLSPVLNGGAQAIEGKERILSRHDREHAWYVISNMCMRALKIPFLAPSSSTTMIRQRAITAAPPRKAGETWARERLLSSKRWEGSEWPLLASPQSPPILHLRAREAPRPFCLRLYVDK